MECTVLNQATKISLEFEANPALQSYTSRDMNVVSGPVVSMTNERFVDIH